MNSVRRGGVVLAGAWVLAMAVAASPGCGGASAESLCELVCDCTGCSESERDDCIDSVDDAQAEAAKEGCDDAYEAFTACAEERLDCDDDTVDLSDCDDEAEDLADCVGANDLPLVRGCASLKSECTECGESQALCEASVDLLEEIGGEDACQEALDAGGINCTDDGSGGGPGGPGQ